MAIEIFSRSRLPYLHQTPVGAIKRVDNERDRDPFLTAPAPNTYSIDSECNGVALN